MVKRRILALFQVVAIPGWLLLCLEVAERSELAEYLNEKRRQLWEFAMTPAGRLVVLLCGVLWLTAVVLWPEIKKRVPRLPRSIHERVHVIEHERIPQYKSEMDAGFSGVWKRCEAMEAKVEHDVGEVEKYIAILRSELLTKIQDEKAFLFNRMVEDEGRTTTAINRASHAHDRIDEHRHWSTDLERMINANRAWSERLPYRLLFFEDITNLMVEAAQCIEYLRRIKEDYAESVAGQRPFSQAWWRSDISEKAPTLVVNWAVFQENHIAHCAAVAAGYQKPQSDLLDAWLMTHSWNSGDGMQGKRPSKPSVRVMNLVMK